jgi:flagellar biosynthesis component FlhA
MVDIILIILAGVMIVFGSVMGLATVLFVTMATYMEIKHWIWRKVSARVREEMANSQKIIDSIMKASKKTPLTIPQMRYAGGEEE